LQRRVWDAFWTSGRDMPQDRCVSWLWVRAWAADRKDVQVVSTGTSSCFKWMLLMPSKGKCALRHWNPLLFSWDI
jgi:hypothetical protein